MTGTRSSSSRCRTERVRRRLQQAFWSLYGRFVWDAEQPSWRQAQIERVVDILASRRTRPAECVLDAGCGTGNYAIALAQAGFQVLGIDYAAGMLASAQAKLTGLSDRSVPADRSGSAALTWRMALDFGGSNRRMPVSIMSSTSACCRMPPTRTSPLGSCAGSCGQAARSLLLHVPRPQSLALPVRDVIRYRVAHLQQKSIGKAALIAAKVIAERTTAAKYWTADELTGNASGRRVRHRCTTIPGPPIVIVAERAVH